MRWGAAPRVVRVRLEGAPGATVLTVDDRPVADDSAAAVNRLADRRVRTVELSLANAGYHADPESRRLLLDAEVWDDLDTPRSPRTALGLVVEALAVRRAQGLEPFAIVSGDEAGDLTRRVVVQFAALRSPELGEWVSAAVPFPEVF